MHAVGPPSKYARIHSLLPSIASLCPISTTVICRLRCILQHQLAASSSLHASSSSQTIAEKGGSVVGVAETYGSDRQEHLHDSYRGEGQFWESGRHYEDGNLLREDEDFSRHCGGKFIGQINQAEGGRAYQERSLNQDVDYVALDFHGVESSFTEAATRCNDGFMVTTYKSSSEFSSSLPDSSSVSESHYVRLEEDLESGHSSSCGDKVDLISLRFSSTTQWGGGVHDHKIERWLRIEQGKRPLASVNKPWQRTLGSVLEVGMRSGMVPSRVYHPRGPLASASAFLTADVKEASSSQDECLSKMWRRRGLGRNKVLPGPTWSTRMLKLARIEATKVERERERVSADETVVAGLRLHAIAPLAIGGGGDLGDAGALYRILQTQRFSDKAEKIFQWAKQQPGYVADARTYAELTRIMAWDGEAEVAEELLTEMWFRDLAVDSITLFAVLAAYAKAERYVELIRLYEHSTRTWQVAEHDACFVLLLWAYARIGQTEEALVIMESREQSPWAVKGDLGKLRRNLRLLQSSGVHPKVQEVMDLVQALCCKRNSQKYTEKVKSLYRNGEKERAGKLAAFVGRYWDVPYWTWRDQLGLLLTGEDLEEERICSDPEQEVDKTLTSSLTYFLKRDLFEEKFANEVKGASGGGWRVEHASEFRKEQEKLSEKERDAHASQMTGFGGYLWSLGEFCRNSTRTGQLRLLNRRKEFPKV